MHFPFLAVVSTFGAKKTRRQSFTVSGTSLHVSLLDVLTQGSVRVYCHLHLQGIAAHENTNTFRLLVGEKQP